MKDEILSQLRAKSEAVEQEPQKGVESGKEDDGQDEVRSQGSSMSSKSSRSSRSSRNRSLETLPLELQMQHEERQFQLERLKLELQMKNEQEKTRLEVEKEKEKTKLEVEKEKTRVRELELEQEKEKEKNRAKWTSNRKHPETQRSRSHTSSESEDEEVKRETIYVPRSQESSKAPQSTSTAPGLRNSNTSGQSKSHSGTYRGDFSQMRCYKCNRSGHIMRDSRQDKRVVTLAMCDPQNKKIDVTQNKPQKVNLVNERYRPFMSKGWISIGGHPEVEIGILRDTEANQSLITRSLIGEGRLLAGRRKMKV
ncbi:splicing regulatory glutamine/lysine-rich protein 1-like [Procambarus clarkii]|uniref:splicing regulatory glutamine/lysine-rich protein 1-like n=2 Tax=Procambarus clarkii TaxID=6728 RepID=UPI003744357C